jgi:predicted phosphodiesterase
MSKLQLVKEFIESKSVKGKCKFSKRKIAAMLAHKYPTEFKNAEAARGMVKVATGASGVKLRKEVTTRVEWKQLDLPEPESHDWTKYKIRESRIAILSDVHFPYYDKTALNAAINHFRKFKPDCILLNGDIIDCYHLSRFEKDIRKRSFSYELDMLKSFFLQLQKLFPNAKLVFVEGNHEQRYEKVILQRVPEFVDMEMFNLESVIEAKKYGIDVIKGKRLIQLGKLNAGHGHEMPTGIAAPVNAARGFFLKTKANFIGGHHHATSSHTESDINDNVIGAWSTGCLCELHPHYMPINRWNSGAATVEVEKGGNFEVDNFKIIKGKIL